MAPQYITITIDGYQVTATDYNDQSVNLSMIFTEMLSAAEAYKVLQPYMDAGAIGGYANFSVAGAPSDNQDRVSFSSVYHVHIFIIGTHKGQQVLVTVFLQTGVEVL